MSRRSLGWFVRLGTMTGCAAALVAISIDAAAITRDEVIATAKAYVYHPWRCETKNLTASCSSTYTSDYVPGDYIGLPYDWGGYMNLFEFDQQIALGYGAGSPYAGDVLDCTAGVDCSGFASQCLFNAYYTTSDIPSVTTAIAQSALLAGDLVNKAGYHVVIFSHLLGNGDPYLYESSPPNARVNAVGGWSYLSGYTPRRYGAITGTAAGDPVGTVTNPIVIGSFPYTDSRDTSQSSSDAIDGCGLAPAVQETGPEYVYKATFTEPGSLTVSVTDDVGVDIDVHLYGSGNTSDCVARHNSTFTVDVDCGSYLIVADTFASGGTEYPGAYTLNVTFTPTNGVCGGGPPSYVPKGKIGEGCTKAFPYCNYTLGAEVCLLTTPEANSFCTKACKTNADCSEFAAGCCEEIGDPGSGEFYCLKSNYCSNPPTDSGAADGSAGSGGTQAQGGSGGTSSQGGSAGTSSQGGSAGSSLQGGSGGSGQAGKGGAASQGGKGGNPSQGGSDPAGGSGGNEAQPPAADSGGCGCTVPGTPRSSGVAMVVLGVLALRRRKRD